MKVLTQKKNRKKNRKKNINKIKIIHLQVAFLSVNLLLRIWWCLPLTIVALASILTVSFQHFGHCKLSAEFRWGCKSHLLLRIRLRLIIVSESWMEISGLSMVQAEVVQKKYILIDGHPLCCSRLVHETNIIQILSLHLRLK